MWVAAMSALLLAGCDTAVAPENRPDKQSDGKASSSLPLVNGGGSSGDHRFAAWAGRWTGVEGMYVDIRPRTSESYELEMQYDLDNVGVFTGHDSEHGIKFMRDGQPLSLRRGSGADTGLKYLAEKRDCLIVKEGEGYCRD